jgi:hypothetical protein
MKKEIIENINSPVRLERLYMENKILFKREFDLVYPELRGNPVADTWNVRLNFEYESVNWGSSSELIFVVIASLIAIFIAKMPSVFGFEENNFYIRNTGFILSPILSAYFIWKNNLSGRKIGIMAGIIVAGVLFINLLPASNRDILYLSSIHMGLFLWVIAGVAFTGNNICKTEKRLGYLKFNGDLLVMTTLILIAGGIMTAVTIGLFELIGFKIEKFYFEYIGISGAAVAPILATYLTQTNPHLVGKVSPVIARIFSPIVLVMLVIFLIAIIVSGRNPYSDREFLLIFNMLLIGVMAIIFFSVSEMSKRPQNLSGVWVLLFLSFVTIIINCIALSAILFRISEWGFSPNRATVLGANLLILVNLVLIAVQLYRVVSKREEIACVGGSIARYLPVYAVWTVIVTFIFPIIF